MRSNRILNRPIRAMLAAAALGGVVLVAPVIAAELGMLDGLSKGLWEVRDRDSGARNQICLRTGHELIQLRHRGLSCDNLVVNDSAHSVTVQYSCRGRGYGHSEIRRESDRLVQIHTQGVEGSSPFDVHAEARYAGGC